MQQLARSTHSLLPRAQTSKVLGSLGNNIGPQFHLDAPLGRTANGDIEKDDGIFARHGGHNSKRNKIFLGV